MFFLQLSKLWFTFPFFFFAKYLKHTLDSPPPSMQERYTRLWKLFVFKWIENKLTEKTMCKLFTQHLKPERELLDIFQQKLISLRKGFLTSS